MYRAVSCPSAGREMDAAAFEKEAIEAERKEPARKECGAVRERRRAAAAMSADAGVEDEASLMRRSESSGWEPP